jgi:hypothetical protein
MSIFDIDHINTVWRLLVPPDKRLPKWLSWGAIVAWAKQWKQDTFFKGYMTGASNLDPIPFPYSWYPSYNVGDRVIFTIPLSYESYYGDNAVYEVLQRMNVPNLKPPSGQYLAPDVAPASANSSPAAALAWVEQYYWVKVQDNFIGANERVMYNASRLIFEWALNKWFFTIFRQPNADLSVHSDIYIQPNIRLYDYLYMGPAGNGYNYIPQMYTQATPFVPLTSALESLTDFTIKYLDTAYAKLNSSPDIAEEMVRAFADKINAAGMRYDIETYS